MTPTIRNATRMRNVLALAGALFAAGTALAQTRPAPIQNPFFKRPAWRLWTEDARPVTLRIRDEEAKAGTAGPVTLEPTAPEKRVYPDFAGEPGPLGFAGLKTFDTPPEAAGFWDDVYITLDRAHSGMPGSFAAGGQSVSLAGQFIRVGVTPGFDATPRLLAGCNFTSQSYALRGRPIVDDFDTNDETERFFLFVNCIRATPSHASYEDRRPEMADDAYDALFSHSFHSLGQSSSEVTALFKMMLAGGCMPRATKDLLKRNGAYATTLLTLFKAALPYADADGRELPYENELRHRPTYSSSGDLGHPHYCPANPYYHAYDDARHVRRMVELARGLTAAPPVALLKLARLEVRKDGRLILDKREPRSDAMVQSDRRLRSLNRTMLRIWGEPGEEITAVIDVRDCYDLQGLPLTVAWQAVYPNQRNVTIAKGAEEGLWRITARHDPALPKGRVPVMLVVRNGRDLPSSPAFVNFYWPEPGERSDRYHYEAGKGLLESGKVLPVMNNKRPLLSLGIADDTVWCKPGETARFAVKASDPEGFAVTLYRRPGEGGTLSGDAFTFAVPADDPGRAYAAHLIASDGTGAYFGRRARILVAAEPPALPEGWRATVLGQPERAGTASFRAGRLELLPGGRNLHPRDQQGLIVYRSVSNDVDTVCRVESFEGAPTAQAGLMLRQGFHDFAPYLLAYVQPAAGTNAALSAAAGFREGPSQWGRSGAKADATLATPARLLRICRQGDNAAAYLSADGATWEQLQSGNVKAWGAECLLGVAAAAGDSVPAGAPVARFSCVPEVAAGPRLPIVLIAPAKNDDKKGAVIVTLVPAPAGGLLRLTLDGSEPVEGSPVYADPLTLDKPGRHEIRAKLWQDGKPGPTVVAVVQVDAKR